MLRKLSEFQGAVVKARDGDVGTVKDVYFDADSWTVRRLGVEARGLARLARCADPPLDPYVVFHHGDVPTRLVLPPEFVERLLPSLSGAPWITLTNRPEVNGAQNQLVLPVIPGPSFFRLKCP